MRKFAYGLFSLLALLAAGTGAQQSGSLNFVGYVRDGVSKDAITGVIVTVVGDRGSATTTTDDNGQFVLHLSPDVKVGSTIRILLQKQGYDTRNELVPVPAELSETFFLRHTKIAHANKSTGPQTNPASTLGKPAPVKTPTSSEPVTNPNRSNTPPRILEYEDAKKRLDSDPDQLTLHDLYLTDFQASEVRHGSILNITGPPGPESRTVRVEATVIWQLEAGTEFVMYYIPSERETPEICMFIADEHVRLLHDAHLLGVEGKVPGESEQASSKGLVFSNRIFIYHEWYMSPEQIIQVRETYKAKGVTVLLRSADYLSNRKLEAKVKKLEKDRN
jgi:hypothetical protein